MTNIVGLIRRIDRAISRIPEPQRATTDEEWEAICRTLNEVGGEFPGVQSVVSAAIERYERQRNRRERYPGAHMHILTSALQPFVAARIAISEKLQHLQQSTD